MAVVSDDVVQKAIHEAKRHGRQLVEIGTLSPSERLALARELATAMNPEDLQAHTRSVLDRLVVVARELDLAAVTPNGWTIVRSIPRATDLNRMAAGTGLTAGREYHPGRCPSRIASGYDMSESEQAAFRRHHGLERRRP